MKKLFKKLTKKTIIAILALLLIVPPLLYLSILNAGKVSAAWYDDSFAYRQTVAITNSGSTQSNYPISLILDTSTLITAGKMQSSCQDLRITSATGKLLSYFIQGGTCNTTTTIIWAKADLIPTTSAFLYVYYGNPSAVDAQITGANMFTVYDDFSESSINSRWSTLSGNGSITQSSGTVNFSYTGASNNDWWTGGRPETVLQLSSLPSGDFHAQIKLNSYTVNDFTQAGISVYGTDTSAYLWGRYLSGATNQYRLEKIGAAITGVDSTTLPAYFAIRRIGASYSFWYSTDGNAWTQTGTTYSDVTFNNIVLFGKEWGSNNLSFGMDDFIIRPTASTEPTTASPSNEEKAPGPIAYWKFDEGTGQTTNDTTTNNVDGTFGASSGSSTDDPSWQTEDACVSGKCLYFDGGDFLDMQDPSNGVVDFAANADFTLSAWVRLKSGADATIIDKAGSVSGNVYGMWVQNSTQTLCLTINSTNSCSSGTQNLMNNTWHHVAVTFDRDGNATFYIDGQSRGTASISSTSGTDLSSTGKLYIGRYDAAINLIGFVDEAKIYNYARSAAQVASDYASRGSGKGSSASFGSDPQNSVGALSNGLVGYWKMDEASWTNDCTATSVTDSSGNSNNGKACPATTGPTGGAAGKFGNAGSFNGTNDRIDVADNSALDFGQNQNFTLSAWVKNTTDYASGEFHGIIGKGDNTASQGFYNFHIDSSEKPAIQIGGASSVTVTANTSLGSSGVWNHVVAVFNRTGNVSFYLNGQSDGGGDISGQNVDLSNDDIMRIASERTAAQFFGGTLDEVHIYNRALSSAEVTALYNFAPGPVGYYDFESATGSTTANDKSGNGYTGTFSGSSNYFTTGKYGKAGNFDGADTAFAATDKILNTSDFSTSFWVKNGSATQVAEATVISNQNDTNNHGFVFANRTASSNDYNFFYGNGAGSWIGINLDKFTLPVGTWTHLAFTKSGANTVIFVNGVATYTRTQSSATVSFTNSSTMRLGSSPVNSDREWNGQLDEVKFYNYPITQKQIVEDMNAGHPPPGSPVGSAVGHWKFDEGYGITANNSGNGSSINGTLLTFASPATATSGWTNSGKFGKGLVFDGTDDTVQVTRTAALEPAEITISGWIKANNFSKLSSVASKQYDGAAGTGSGGGNTSYSLHILTNAKASFNLQNSGGAVALTAPGTLSTGTWYHLAATYSGSTMRLYIDGREVNSGSFTGPIVYNTGAGYDLELGKYLRSDPSFGLNGYLDEVKIYNYALTADQIKLDMNRSSTQVLGALSDNSSYQVQAANQEYCIPGDSTSCASPIGRWDFEEAVGATSANDTTGTAAAASITGATYTTGKIGKALNFNGGTDAATVSTSISTKTVEFWVNPSTTTQNLIDLRTAATAASISVSSGTIAATGFTSPTIYVNGVVNGTISANAWNHVAVTTGTAITANAISFGRISSTSLTGKLDSIRFFDYARSAAQVAWDYNRGAPVGHWKFDECQGTTAYDSSTNGNGASNGNTGTITPGAGGQTAVGTCTGSAGTMWADGATGKRNSSLDFDGTDDYVGIAYQSFLNLGNAFTLAAWIKPNSNEGPIISTLDVDNGVRTKGYKLGINQDAANGVNANSLVIQFGKNAWGWNVYSSPTSSITTGSWQHVVVTISSADTASPTVKFYINGIERTATFWIGSTKGAIYWGDNANSNRLGSTYTATFPTYSETYFNGTIDEPKIYNHSLTAAQIKSLYNDGAVRFGPVTGSP